MFEKESQVVPLLYEEPIACAILEINLFFRVQSFGHSLYILSVIFSGEEYGSFGIYFFK